MRQRHESYNHHTALGDTDRAWEKRFENRRWATKHRGELAIHAGKKVDREMSQRGPF